MGIEARRPVHELLQTSTTTVSLEIGLWRLLCSRDPGSNPQPSSGVVAQTPPAASLRQYNMRNNKLSIRIWGCPVARASSVGLAGVLQFGKSALPVAFLAQQSGAFSKGPTTRYNIHPSCAKYKSIAGKEAAAQ